MKSLSKELHLAHDDISKRLEAAMDTITDAAEAFNDVLLEAAELANYAVQEIQDYIDDRSEKWWESGRGESYVDWQSTWENIDMEPVEIDIDIDAFASAPLDLEPL